MSYTIAASHPSKVPINVDVGSLLTGAEDDNNLLSELLEEKGSELKPDENMIEIWVRTCI